MDSKYSLTNIPLKIYFREIFHARTLLFQELEVRVANVFTMHTSLINQLIKRVYFG